MSEDAGAGRQRRKRKPDTRTSREFNDKYVRRSCYLFEMILSLVRAYDDPEELAAMNRGKRGRPYMYTHSLMAMVSRVRDVLHLTYRSCEGMCEAAMEEGYPDFTTIFRRINAQRVFIGDSISGITCEKFSFKIVPDGTGLTPFARSEYIRIVHKVRRGFIRLVIMIDRDTQEIIAFSVTDSSVGETAAFRDLLEDALRNLGIDPDERRRQAGAQKGRGRGAYPEITMTADGGFDSREIFSMCKELGIITNIRVRTDSNARAGGVDRARSEAVLDQLGGPGAAPADLAALDKSGREANRRDWKRRVDYGMRWLVEIVISAFKRLYGGAVMARTMENIRQEIRLKIRTYNTMLRVGREVPARF